ncbi:hypothetical protein TRFO_36925 [Tritrichomonas foetus]|uniref:RING-type domain-containing protein n=1 Tax=Tritrichomonas foetus TaxID=1144522 RepID=A0A1J4JF98_9EUKA|nr:hypothetical protein TRFO_36925 [Tritrichomonas foetus]|eukprot:OHS96967.1 hypothetical protein TRFO_36925 [Tritrichomonas foetus]
MTENEICIRNILSIDYHVPKEIKGVLGDQIQEIQKLYTHDSIFFLTMKNSITIFDHSFQEKIELFIPKNFTLGAINVFAQSNKYLVVGHLDGYISIFSIQLNKENLNDLKEEQLNTSYSFCGVTRITPKSNFFVSITSIEVYSENEFIIGYEEGLIYMFMVKKEADNDSLSFLCDDFMKVNPFRKSKEDIISICKIQKFIYVLTTYHFYIIDDIKSNKNGRKVIQTIPKNGYLQEYSQLIQNGKKCMLSYAYNDIKTNKKVYKIEEYIDGNALTIGEKLSKSLDDIQNNEIYLIKFSHDAILLMFHEMGSKIAKILIYLPNNDILAMNSVEIAVPKFFIFAGYLTNKEKTILLLKKGSKNIFISFTCKEWMKKLVNTFKGYNLNDITTFAQDSSNIILTKSLSHLGMGNARQRMRIIVDIIESYHEKLLSNIFRVISSPKEAIMFCSKLILKFPIMDLHFDWFWKVIFISAQQNRILEEIIINVKEPFTSPIVFEVLYKAPETLTKKVLTLILEIWENSQKSNWKNTLFGYLMNIKFTKSKYSWLEKIAKEHHFYLLYVHVLVICKGDFIAPIDFHFDRLDILSYLWEIMKGLRASNNLTNIQRFELKNSYETEEILEFRAINLNLTKYRHALPKIRTTIINEICTNENILMEIIQKHNNYTCCYLSSLVIREMLNYDPSIINHIIHVFRYHQNILPEKPPAINIIYQMLIYYAYEKRIDFPILLYKYVTSVVLYSAPLFSFPHYKKCNLEIFNEIHQKYLSVFISSDVFLSSEQNNYTKALYNMSINYSGYVIKGKKTDFNLIDSILNDFTNRQIELEIYKQIKEKNEFNDVLLMHSFIILCLKSKYFHKIIRFLNYHNLHSNNFLLSIGNSIFHSNYAKDLHFFDDLPKKFQYFYLSLFLSINSKMIKDQFHQDYLSFQLNCSFYDSQFLLEKIPFFLESYLLTQPIQERDTILLSILDNNYRNKSLYKKSQMIFVENKHIQNEIQNICERFILMKSLFFIKGKEDSINYMETICQYLSASILILIESGNNQNYVLFQERIRVTREIIGYAFQKIFKSQKQRTKSATEITIRMYKMIINMFLPFLWIAEDKHQQGYLMLFHFFEYVINHLISSRMAIYSYKIIGKLVADLSYWKFLYIDQKMIVAVSEKSIRHNHTLKLWKIDENLYLRDVIIAKTMGVSPSYDLCTHCTKALLNSPNYIVYCYCGHQYHLKCFMKTSVGSHCPKCFDEESAIITDKETVTKILGKLRPPNHFEEYNYKYNLSKGNNSVNINNTHQKSVSFYLSAHQNLYPKSEDAQSAFHSDEIITFKNSIILQANYFF